MTDNQSDNQLESGLGLAQMGDLEPAVLKRFQAWTDRSGPVSENDIATLESWTETSVGRNQIREAFYQDLEFGTGGLRGIVRLGPNGLNIYTVRKAAQALATHLVTTAKGKDSPSKEHSKSVVIGLDSRISSKSFSQEMASVLAANGITVRLFDRPVPTPLLSYCVRALNASAGIMITASHNPKDYNGIKMYGADGCQVVPPDDQKIIEHYQNTNLSSIKNCEFDWACEQKLVRNVSERTVENYLDDIGRIVLKNHSTGSSSRSTNSESTSKILAIYTPLHGTGGEFVSRLAKKFDLNIQQVRSQSAPDGSFPTAASPNPEDPKTLQLGLEKMERLHGQLVIGSDPDSDRMGVIVATPQGPLTLTGNQIAFLLQFHSLKQAELNESLNPRSVVIKTIVTSEIQQKISDHFGVEMINTLTGFKWMGSYLTNQEESGNPRELVFASEESFGTLVHDRVRDKDGIAPILSLISLAQERADQGQTLLDELISIYDQFGQYREKLITLNFPGIEGKVMMSRLMDRARQTGLVPDGETLTETFDCLSGQRKFVSSEESELVDLPQSNVLGFIYENGNRLWLRPSGTEPKIKFYMHCLIDSNEMTSKTMNAREKFEMANQLAEEKFQRWEAFLNSFLEQ